jgi:DNA polymerase III delta prime subunit
VKWVVVAKDAQESVGRYTDFVRAMKDLGVSVGAFEEFVELFVPRDQISRWLQRKTDTLLHNVGYVPQHLTTSTSGKLAAVETVLGWVRSRDSKTKLGLIHAPAGHGKTIFLERLAIELLGQARKDKSTPTPFLLRFADHRGVDTIEELCMHVLNDVGRSDVPVDALKDLLRRGRIVLLFDGLDELSEEVGERIGLENIRTLADLIRRDSEGRVVVTCRSTFLEARRSVTQQLLSGDHELWELLPFDEDDQRTFLEHNPPEGITGDSVNRHRDRVVNFVHQNPVVAEFATSPFLLKQISLAVAENATALPRNMGDVYERFLGSLCEREIKRQQHGISAERQMVFLRRVAHEMVYEQVYAYPQDLFEMIIADLFDEEIRSAPAPAARKKELFAKLTGHAAFTPLPVQGVSLGCEIQFLHESMRDYGAASYLVTLLGLHNPDSDVSRSALCRRTLPEGVIGFMRDALDARGLAGLGQVAQRTPPIMDNQNLFRIATSSPVPDAPSLAFAFRRCANMDLAGITVEDVSLSRFTFDGSNLGGMRFVSCDLSECNFESAVLAGATIEDCDLSGARFAHAHGISRVDDVLSTRGGDITAALLNRGALVGGQRQRTSKEMVARSHDGRALVEHVLRKFYNGTTPANARRRSRYDDVLERGRAGEERVLIRGSVVPALETAGLLDRSQRGVYSTLSVTKDANAEVVNFLFRGVPSERISRVVGRVEEMRKSG